MQTVVNIFLANKAVVGSGCRDRPKYVGVGVASHSLLGESSGSNGSIGMQFHVVFHIFSVKCTVTCLKMLHSTRIIIFYVICRIHNVTLPFDIVMSWMMSLTTHVPWVM